MPYDQHEEQQASMRAFANATGGRPCLNSNGLEKCFADAVDDSRTYYLLGFYLRPDDRKPGWRKLKVQVAASGAHLRARGGFYVSAPAEDTPLTRHKQLSDALLSQVSYTGMRLRASALDEDAQEPASGTPDPAKTARRPAYFKLSIPADNFTLDRIKSGALNLEVAVVAFDRKWKPADQDSHSVNVRLNTVKLEEFLQAGIMFRMGLNLAPGSYQLRFAVRDNVTGQIGTVQLPFERK
jgi:hypothetical protein